MRDESEVHFTVKSFDHGTTESHPDSGAYLVTASLDQEIISGVMHTSAKPGSTRFGQILDCVRKKLAYHLCKGTPKSEMPQAITLPEKTK